MAIDPNNLSATAVLTFDDEFDTLSLWNGVTGTWEASYPWAGPSGGTNTANSEMQWFINPNYVPTQAVNPFSVSNGILTIEAAPSSPAIEAITGYPYTSGMITTAHSFVQTFGYFEIRAQLPAGQGLWPAFWMLPTDMTWPPEIDIMQAIGSEPNTNYTFVHYGAELATGQANVATGATTGFHTYGVNWQKDMITWYFDGHQVFQTANPSDVVKPMYLLANLSVGGSEPGSPDATTVFPADLKIDYIRAYEAMPDPVAVNQTLIDLSISAPATHYINGTAANETITGTAANDFLDSWGGADVINGGLGDDQYLVYTSKAKVIENFDSGIDTVRSGSTTFTLPDHVENGVLVGNGNKIDNGSQTLIGNALDNLMVSNSSKYANVLNGGDGNDQIFAGKGADVLTGGAGDDQFVFSNIPLKPGHITDFTVGSDLIDLTHLFEKINYNGPDPIADHLLTLTANSRGGTNVFFDADGTGVGKAVQITAVDHVLPVFLNLQAEIWFHI